MKLQLVLTACTLGGAALSLLCCPVEVSSAVREGLTLCADTLFPCLFPFFILSALVVKTGVSDLLGRGLERAMRPLFHLPGCCSSAVVLGLIGGYPTGARTAVSLYREGRCTREEAQRLLAFCCNCGPAYLLGVVGSGMFGAVRYGLLLEGANILSAILVGILMNRRSAMPAAGGGGGPLPSYRPFSAVFVESVTESMGALLDLCAFVLCFCAIRALAALSGLPALLGEQLLPFLHGENGAGVLLGLLEMTGGVPRLVDGPVVERLLLSSLLVGWGGLSIHFQIMALLRDTDLSPALFFRGKLLHALLSPVVLLGLLGQWVWLCVPLLLLPLQIWKKSSGKTVGDIV